MHLQPWDFSLEWNGLLLAYLEGSWIIMLSSVLIGCFTVQLNVELCSDWLFHSAAHFSSSHSRKETQGGKYIFQYFLSQLYCRVIILYIKHGHQGAAINMRGTETAFKCTIAFYFRFRDSQSHVLCLYYGVAVITTHFTRSDAFQWCSGSVNHSQSSSVISPYTVYVVSEILCTVM